jgi:superfamily II DNA or RNA helicase
MTPGSIVRCRNRDWVLLPDQPDRPELIFLRPLAGATDDVVAVHRRLTNLIGGVLPQERVAPSRFLPPTSADLSDATSSHLLWQAARLTLREGATPFRSLGRISIRPRVYQFVPLLMALRLDPVRLFIADDVGVGKTIEALLVVRELLDRGEIRRLCVLCPPYLCDQWQQELAQKMNLDAVVIRSGTVGQLERQKASADSIYRHYPIQVASIDFLKTDRNRHQFLLHCPEFVIVDEAHGAAANDRSASQQQRHQLLRAIAEDQSRHLVLLTATPHSGIDTAFKSLLGLVRPEFGAWDVGSLDEKRRIELARHFVQRTRRDIEDHWEGEHCFPTREPKDVTYRLSDAYRDLFRRTYDFCSAMVRTGQTLDERRRRVRYWAALGLLRSVMSSPMAAVAALDNRHARLAGTDEATTEEDFKALVFESSEDRTDDASAAPAVDAAEETLEDPEKTKLRDLARRAAKLANSTDDTKVTGCAALVDGLLKDGFHPIVWCRFIATAQYVGAHLAKTIPAKRSVQVVVVTGLDGDEERRAKVAAIDPEKPRVLVATDCLSEGINLQDRFNAALHYDLPWNPNRLEQREGRVDRYGQRSPTVTAIRYFSPDNAVDGVVLDVLLNKAREIHRTLGTHVPVPEQSDSVTQALLNALFIRANRVDDTQQALDFGEDVPAQITAFHREWDREVEREKVNRTRFAQRALKPAEVKQELETADAVLGDPAAVREFVLNAAQRLNLHIIRQTRSRAGAAAEARDEDLFRMAVSEAATAGIPDPVRYALPAGDRGQWLVSFSSPTPEGAEYLGRNHPFVAALARYLLEEALTRHADATASRCGVIRTKAVDRLTFVMLLRVRYLIEQPKRPPLLSEEVLLAGGVEGARGQVEWMTEAAALRHLADAKPDANIPLREKQTLADRLLQRWPDLQPGVEAQIKDRAKALEGAHKRVRQAVSMRVRELAVTPQLPPDLLGLLILQPVV